MSEGQAGAGGGLATRALAVVEGTADADADGASCGRGMAIGDTGLAPCARSGGWRYPGSKSPIDTPSATRSATAYGRRSRIAHYTQTTPAGVTMADVRGARASAPGQTTVSTSAPSPITRALSPTIERTSETWVDTSPRE